MIEYEIKSMIHESMLLQYKQKLDKLAVPKRILQINYYYDTKDFLLNSLGNTLRVRQKGDKLIQQFKYDKKYTGRERSCKEFEKAIEYLSPHILSRELPNDMLKDDLIFYFIGNLITERVDYTFNDVIISLDKNYYLGNYDCEIEVEYQNYDKVESLLELINFEKSSKLTMGKYSRFIKKLQEL